MGCGVVAGLAVIALVIGIVAFVGSVRELDRGEEAAEKVAAELVEMYGPPERYVPPADGAVPAGRIEVFLAVRDSLAGPSGEVVRILGELAAADSIGFGPKRFVRSLRSGLDLGGAITAMSLARNRALIEQGMGFGEYVWIYCTAYHGWLGEEFFPPLGDGLLGDKDTAAVNSGFDSQKAAVIRLAGVMLANQLEAAEAAGDPGGLAEVLRRESGLVAADQTRLPWPEGPPDATAASFEPYRERLAASYRRAVAVLDLLNEEEDFKLSF